MSADQCTCEHESHLRCRLNPNPYPDWCCAGALVLVLYDEFKKLLDARLG